MVVGYGNQVWIKAAKDLGIETIEFQHSYLTKYHIGYGYPNIKYTPEYFPDKMFIWDDIWKNVDWLPIPPENRIVRGFDYLNKERKKYKNFEKIPNQLCVISQGTYTDKITSILIKNKYQFKNYKIIYKLHPGEFLKLKNHEGLNKLKSWKNLTVVKEEIPLYELLAKSSWLIGVNSVMVPKNRLIVK